MDKFTQEEIRNILALINIAPINGNQATTVVLLQQKLVKLLNEDIQTSPKGDKTGE